MTGPARTTGRDERAAQEREAPEAGLTAPANPAVAQVLSLQRGAGNRVAAAALMRHGGPGTATPAPAAAPPGKAPLSSAGATAAETIYSALNVGGLSTPKIESVLQACLAQHGEAAALRDSYKSQYAKELDEDLKKLGDAGHVRALDYLDHGKLRSMSKLLIALAGVGTDLPTTYRVLADTHAEGNWNTAWTEVANDARFPLNEKFRGQTLEAALKDDLSGWELVKAIAISEYGKPRPIDQVWMAMDQAGTDEAMLFEGLAGCNGDTIEADFKAYQLRHLGGLGTDIWDALDSELSGEDWHRALALVGWEENPEAGWFNSKKKVRKITGGNRLVALVKAGIGGLGTNTELLWKSIEGAKPGEIAELRGMFLSAANDDQRAFVAHVQSDLNAGEMARFRAMLNLPEPKDAAGLASGRSEGTLADPLVQALRARGGVDSDSVFKTVQLSAGKLWTDLGAAYNDGKSATRNYIDDNTNAPEKGALPIIFSSDVRKRLDWCVTDRMNDDEDYLFHVAKTFTTDADKRALQKDTAWQGKMKSALSSSEYTQLTSLLRPSDESGTEAAKALDAAVKSATGGPFDLVDFGAASAVADENRELQAGAKAANKDGKVTPEEEAKLKASAEKTSAALQDYITARDEFLGAAEMVLNIAVGLLVTFASGGTAGPIVAAQLARAAATMAMIKVLTAKALRGDQFDVFGSDGAVAFASGAADGIMNVVGGAAARGVLNPGFKALGTTAEEAAKSSFGKVGVKLLHDATEGGIGGGVGSLVETAARDETWRGSFTDGLVKTASATGAGAAQGAAISTGVSAAGAIHEGVTADGAAAPGTAPHAGGSTRTAADWAAMKGALGDLGDKVPLIENPKLPDTTVRVRYGEGSVHLEVGPGATAVHIARHLETVRFLKKYDGVLGTLMRVKERVEQIFLGIPGYGSKGFEANAEIKKLEAIRDELRGTEASIKKRLDAAVEAADASATQAQLAALQEEMASIEKQLEKHRDNIGSLEKGAGFVAAEGVDYSPAPKDWPRQACNPRKVGGRWTGFPDQIPDGVVLTFPDGAMAWKNAGGEIVIDSKLAPGPGRSGHESNMPSRTGFAEPEYMAALYERAHSQGQGTGHESPYGIRMAPQVVNQRLQRYGIEEWLYKLRDSGDLPAGVDIQLVTITSTVPGSMKLEAISYRLDVVQNGKRTQFLNFTIEVGAPGPTGIPPCKVTDFSVVGKVDDHLMEVFTNEELTGAAQQTIQTRLANGAPWANVKFEVGE